MTIASKPSAANRRARRLCLLESTDLVAFAIPRDIRPPIREQDDNRLPPAFRTLSARTKTSSSPAASGVPPPPGSPANARFARSSDRVGGKRTSAVLAAE